MDGQQPVRVIRISFGFAVRRPVGYPAFPEANDRLNEPQYGGVVPAVILLCPAPAGNSLIQVSRKRLFFCGCHGAQLRTSGWQRLSKRSKRSTRTLMPAGP